MTSVPLLLTRNDFSCPSATTYIASATSPSIQTEAPRANRRSLRCGTSSPTSTVDKSRNTGVRSSICSTPVTTDSSSHMADPRARQIASATPSAEALSCFGGHCRQPFRNRPSMTCPPETRGEVTHPSIALLISFDDGAMNPEKEPPDVADACAWCGNRASTQECGCWVEPLAAWSSAWRDRSVRSMCCL